MGRKRPGPAVNRTRPAFSRPPRNQHPRAVERFLKRYRRRPR